MTAYIRKSIAMGVFDLNDVNQNFGYWAADWYYTNTPYVRFWIPWYKLAPYGMNNPATDGSPLPGSSFTVAQHVAGLDAQIKYARQLGLKVVLTFDWFPQWANGTPDRRTPPPDVSVGSAWATYLAWIIARWSALNPNNNGAYADFIEICNEPNGYTAIPGTYPAAHYVAGRMMMTAQTIQSYGWTTPILCGPAIADKSTAASFTADLLGYLQSSGFWALTLPGGNPYFAWTQHNYGDIESGGGGTSRAQGIGGQLVNRWKGWPNADPGNPYVLITEGGARLANFSQADAAARTALAYNNAHNEVAGRGLAMFTNYLDVSDTQPSGDCGLRNTDAGRTPRPLYTTWSGLPQP